MTKVPPYLKPGDTIGIVCPAGYMALERVQTCIDTLGQWGYKTKIGRTLGGSSENYFSGNDDERLHDLQEMMNDDNVHAVLCARGGYGVGRIIDRLNFKKFIRQPKWLIGFSDVTVLHAHIYSNFKIATLHAPMAAAFNEGGSGNEYVHSLKDALEGKKMRYETGAHDCNIRGEAAGELVGGNLALLAHVVGTASDFKTRGRILFLEDIGEYLYNVDRMLYQLKRNGKFRKLAALIIGGFSDMKDTERPFGKNAYEILHDIFKDADYPVCFNFPVSHQKENYALKVGVYCKLRVGKNRVALEE
jgi:muramoyltetrapeptide carboxypeptidase